MNILTGKLKKQLIKMVFSKSKYKIKKYKEEVYKMVKDTQ
jgi:hypothetical protein